MDKKVSISITLFIIGAIFIVLGIFDFPFEPLIPVIGKFSPIEAFIIAGLFIVIGVVIILLHIKAENDYRQARQIPMSARSSRENEYYGPEGAEDDGFNKNLVNSAFAGGTQRAAAAERANDGFAPASQAGKVTAYGAKAEHYTPQTEQIHTPDVLLNDNPMLGGNKIVKEDVKINESSNVNMDPALGGGFGNVDPGHAHTNISAAAFMFGDTAQTPKTITGNGLKEHIPGGGFVDPMLGGGNQEQ